MRATVKLIEGLHITAADKRNILDGIEYLRETFARFVEASPETVFARDNDAKWEMALHSLGIEPSLLSGSAGHA